MKTFGSILRMMKNRYVAGATISATTTFAKDAGLKTGGGFTRGRRTSMKLIDANAVVTANLYDDEHEEFIQKKVTVGELVDFCSEEGCPKAVEAIPVEWIEKHIEELQESFESFTGWPSIENMLMKWKEEQK